MERTEDMSHTIQQRIRLRREAFGASIDQMAIWADLPSNRWREIETGDGFTVAELGQLAQALAVDPGCLLRGEEGDPGRTIARFRQAADAVQGCGVSEVRTLALAAELGRIGGDLYRLLGRGLTLSKVRQILPIDDCSEPWKIGYRLGAAARHRLKIPGGPIMNLQIALEGFSVHIATLAFSQSSVDAASLMEGGALPMILLNQASPRVQSTLPRRTTLAHELCHLLHDAGEHDLAAELSGKESSVDDLVEQRARAFAPAFLAPPDEVRHWFRSGRGMRWREPRQKILALARRWGLSWQGAVWHAKNCGLIQAATADRLVSDPGIVQDWQTDFEQARVAASSVSEVDLEVTELCRGRLAQVVREAHELGVISHGRAVEILTWG